MSKHPYGRCLFTGAPLPKPPRTGGRQREYINDDARKAANALRLFDKMLRRLLDNPTIDWSDAARAEIGGAMTSMRNAVNNPQRRRKAKRPRT